jgi:hypothetical protein
MRSFALLVLALTICLTPMAAWAAERLDSDAFAAESAAAWTPYDGSGAPSRSISRVSAASPSG